MKIAEVKQLDTNELVEKIENAETALDKMKAESSGYSS